MLTCLITFDVRQFNFQIFYLLSHTGIEGLEGKQASMAADFSVGRFKHLVRLLFVHGHWTYDRLSVMTLYNFFKNSVSLKKKPLMPSTLLQIT